MGVTPEITAIKQKDGKDRTGYRKGILSFSCERERKSRRKLLKAKRMPGQTRRTGYKKIMCRIQKFPVGSTKENRLLFNGKSRMIYIDITE